MKPIIRVDNLTKHYHLDLRRRQGATLRDAVGMAMRSPSTLLWPRSKYVEVVCALQDVTFDVLPGETIGIVGRNGAGKSTLLKILSRITEPTRGAVDLYGRVASLLEVGTGFHPELTGRENIFLNGAMLGMRQTEIQARFEDIVEFAETGRYLDTPVKHYSSGMYMRLAFSVAAHLQPDILVVDEVLAVGDAAFQRKCLGKMGEVAREGRTVIFVSHSLPAIERLCSSAIYLSDGRIRAQGRVAEVLSKYHRDSISPKNQASHQSLHQSRKVTFSGWRVNSTLEGLPHTCVSRDFCEFSFRLVTERRIENARFGFAIRDTEGQLIVVGNSLDIHERDLDIEIGRYDIQWSVSLPLKAGSYQIQVAVSTVSEGTIEEWFPQQCLTVLPRLATHLSENWHGLLNEPIGFKVTSHSKSNAEELVVPNRTSEENQISEDQIHDGELYRDQL